MGLNGSIDYLEAPDQLSDLSLLLLCLELYEHFPTKTDSPLSVTETDMSLSVSVTLVRILNDTSQLLSHNGTVARSKNLHSFLSVKTTHQKHN